MADRPIPFSRPMVRAILEGRKTQTRRVLDAWCDEPPAFIKNGIITAFDENDRPYRWPNTKAIGDRLYVREKILRWDSAGVGYVRYDAEQKATFHAWPDHWTRDWAPPMFMLRHMSRLTLRVTDVRIERVQEISHDDAVAEGVGVFPHSMSAQNRFRELWDSINGERKGGVYSWGSNPWVAAITFTVHHGNIDALERAA